MLPFLDQVGISTLHYLQLSDEASGADRRFPRTQVESIGVDQVKALSSS